ncbi:hypothetical protein PIROE2DRAFT_17174 [Piromyces sp. E2]|nr:hypothetical protein PIROE2DRAFT_17174 [Piromyces sp. E2]|eukprot:OUM57742.1 hypothetical protein PIROE2DRAFT_17174 [Piromyces sp. E2]
MKTFEKKDFIYTSCYCEENVYKLCEKLHRRFFIPLSRIYAVFISNEDKQDYHVIALVKGEEGQPNVIFDFDSTLPFPCEFNAYIINAIYPKHFARIIQQQQE